MKKAAITMVREDSADAHTRTRTHFSGVTIKLISVSFSSIVLTPLRHLTSGGKRGSKGGGKFWPFLILQVQEGTGQPSFPWPPARAEKTEAAAPGAPTPCTGRDNTRSFLCFEA
ncbi:hypothetical protein QQF64_027555 [Cirrhinus molitorella]|uniref:Uncharacterized protein n=1 Tax=Cirrhinus molitorella TaxID=172907 RepID=A0ABR3ND37_9TELE